MTDNVLVFEFLAKDHFSGTAEKVSHKLDTMGERLGAVGKAAAFALGKVAVGGVAAFGFEMVKGIAAATQYQALQLKTAAVIKSTGNVAHLSVDGLSEMAHRLQEMSGVEEALILNSENVLATFTNIRNSTGKNNDIYNQATARILDLSVAMGEDLQTATVQVGKALNDPIKGMTALQRVGVTFNATQKEQIKHLVASGNLMGAQKIILGELSKEFGGAAKAAGSGFGGALMRLKESLDDTFRDMAAGLLPVLTKAADWLAQRLPGAIAATRKAFVILGGWLATIGRIIGPPVILFFRTMSLYIGTLVKTYGPVLIAFFKNLGGYLVGLGKTYGPVVLGFFKTLGDRFSVFADKKLLFVAIAGAIGGVLIPVVAGLVLAFGALAVSVWAAISPLLPFIAVGAAVAAVAYLVVNNWDRVAAAFSFLTPVIGAVVHYFRDMLMPALREAGAKVFPAIRNAIASVGAAFKDHQDVIRDFGKIFLFILKAVGVALAVLGILIVKVVIPVIAELLVTVLSVVGPVVRALLLITGTLLHVVTGLASFAVNAAQVIARIAVAIAAPFATAGKWLYHAGQAVITGLVQGLTDAYAFVVHALQLDVQAITGAFKAARSWLIGAGSAVIEGLVNGITTVWPHILIAMRHTMDFMIGPFKPAASWLVHAGQVFITGLIAGAQNEWHMVTGWITTAINAIKAFFAPAVRWLTGSGANILRGLMTGMASFYGIVTRGVRDFITRYLWAPFVGAASWLIRHGADFIAGLWHGIVGVGEWLRRSITGFIVNKIWAPFAGVRKWLIDAGYNLIGGLWTGISKAIAGARDWISRNLVTPIVNAVRWFFGIHSPSTVMAGIGGHMIAGLIQGMLRHNPLKMITKIFGGMPAALGAIVNKGLVSIASLPGRALAALGSLGGDVLGALGAGSGNVRVQGGGNSANRQLGQKMAAYYGWTGNQWAALNNLWMGESGWNNLARNPSSGAFGIPQALPPGKMGAAAAGGNASAQIAWGLSYIRSVYGSPANAYAKWLARSPHWYDEGGILRGKGFFGKNTGADERVLSPRQTKWFERAMALGVRSGGGQGHGGVTLILNAPNYIGSRNDLLDEFNRFARQGRLDSIVRMASR